MSKRFLDFKIGPLKKKNVGQAEGRDRIDDHNHGSWLRGMRLCVALYNKRKQDTAKG
jgi:hypothetical protein